MKEFVSGTLALEFLKENSDTCRFIIFLDINMPEMSGWEFLENMKKNSDSIYEVHVVTISINPEDKLRARKHNSISSFTEKPFTSKKFKGDNFI
ncbi:response regulator [Salegentibacter sp. LM13S]|uniref:response regulator n=1 Tax=Salegentibacter lacus TaxID=2873599 RepID=UPI001CCF888D|nr:response regulator [Salegentibacter lacus]MBZ9631279.1 response regulator [Salegentibacter lacus]